MGEDYLSACFSTWGAGFSGGVHESVDRSGLSWLREGRWKEGTIWRVPAWAGHTSDKVRVKRIRPKAGVGHGRYSFDVSSKYL